MKHVDCAARCFEHLCPRRGGFCAQANPMLPRGMTHVEAKRMQHEVLRLRYTGCVHGVRPGLVGPEVAVLVIHHDRVAGRGEVDADLMRTSGSEHTGQEGRPRRDRLEDRGADSVGNADAKIGARHAEMAQDDIIVGVVDYPNIEYAPLIDLALGDRVATQIRAHNLPTFADTVPARHIDGTTLTRPTTTATSVKPQDAAKKVLHHL